MSRPSGGDKFDFITVESVIVPDPTGREVLRAFRVNGDFARVRGIEASYLKRVGERFSGQVSASFSRATGLSSTNNDALSDFLANGDIDNTFETPLAWDRPFDFKTSLTFQHDKERPLFGVKGLNRISALVASTLRSGQRYTPVEYQGNEVKPFQRRTGLASDFMHQFQILRPAILKLGLLGGGST